MLKKILNPALTTVEGLNAAVEAARVRVAKPAARRPTCLGLQAQPAPALPANEPKCTQIGTVDIERVRAEVERARKIRIAAAKQGKHPRMSVELQYVFDTGK